MKNKIRADFNTLCSSRALLLTVTPVKFIDNKFFCTATNADNKALVFEAAVIEGETFFEEV